MTQIILSIIVLIAIAIIFRKQIIQLISATAKNKVDFSVYQRKPFLFDANSEFNLYKVLLELFGNEYFIFPQVNYSHLIETRKTNWQDERKYRSRIDRKSADFVFCDKERIVPKLIIELDGSVHNFKNKQARDEFINELTKIVDLPLLHLKPGNLTKEFIKSEVEKKLRK